MSSNVFGFNNLPIFTSAKPNYQEVAMPASTHVFLVRHGQSEGNAANCFGGHSQTPLSALGHRQAALTADCLAAQNITAIYSSDLIRAVDTAAPLAKKLNLEIQQTAALRERHVGVLQCLSFTEAAEKFPLEYGKLLTRDYDFVITEGESYAEVVTRAATKLDEIRKLHTGEKIAVFAHTGTICFLILHLLGALDTANKQPVWITTQNCGITHFEFREASLSLLHSINDIRHLATL